MNALFGEPEELPPAACGDGPGEARCPARPFIYVTMPINLAGLPQNHEYYRMEPEAKLNILNIQHRIAPFVNFLSWVLFPTAGHVLGDRFLIQPV